MPRGGRGLSSATPMRALSIRLATILLALAAAASAQTPTPSPTPTPTPSPRRTPRPWGFKHATETNANVQRGAPRGGPGRRGLVPGGDRRPDRRPARQHHHLLAAADRRTRSARTRSISRSTATRSGSSRAARARSPAGTCIFGSLNTTTGLLTEWVIPGSIPAAFHRMPPDQDGKVMVWLPQTSGRLQSFNLDSDPSKIVGDRLPLVRHPRLRGHGAGTRRRLLAGRFRQQPDRALRPQRPDQGNLLAHPGPVVRAAQHRADPVRRPGLPLARAARGGSARPLRPGHRHSPDLSRDQRIRSTSTSFRGASTSPPHSPPPACRFSIPSLGVPLNHRADAS